LEPTEIDSDGSLPGDCYKPPNTRRLLIALQYYVHVPKLISTIGRAATHPTTAFGRSLFFHKNPGFENILPGNTLDHEIESHIGWYIVAAEAETAGANNAPRPLLHIACLYLSVSLIASPFGVWFRELAGSNIDLPKPVVKI
jgi:hypothetical protein